MASVDVAVPCYQYGHFLRESVTSVLDQDLRDVRVLIIDNGSTDDSLDVARDLAASDPRVEVLAYPSNRGPHACYNAGIDWASADYFLVLDADDYLAPGCLSRAAAIMDRHRDISFTHGIEGRILPGCCAPAETSEDPDAQWEISTGIAFIERLCRKPVNPVGSPTVIRRTSAQKQVGYYRPQLPYTDDLEMWLRLAMVGSVAHIRRIQAIRRLHERQLSFQYERAHHVRSFREREAAFDSFFANEGRSLTNARQLTALMKRGLSDHAYWSALSHTCRGHGRAGLELLKFSAQRRRISPLVPPVGWLLRMDSPMERVLSIGAEMIGKRRS
jgi:glycosyltransferase involved in cell wall biosynthesis